MFFVGSEMLNSKWEFLWQETHLLGHDVSREGNQANPEKTLAVKKHLVPKTDDKVKSFIGL